MTTVAACAQVGKADDGGRPPRLRADALRNRERIIAAARETMVESGADVPLDEIARRAGVGNATLYRHFADRLELIHHVTLSVMSRTADRAERALAEESDAFQALRRFAHDAVAERIGALCPLLSDGVDRDHPDLVAARERLEGAVEALMGAARDSGRLRTDIDVGDLMVAITQLTRPLPGWGAAQAEPGGACPGFDMFVHRHLQLFLDGLQTPARSELPGSAATLADLRRRARPAARTRH
ncbi:TetR/AcrR family transcriptional regulator [Streptomyces sp. NPDC001339]|uniref:TetR/AcrR family transcriptional regulator n=1 Tax=Streptomyces sp. NPDC001339 TaxID=3364563 RepID=UPI00367B3C3C